MRKSENSIWTSNDRLWYLNSELGKIIDKWCVKGNDDSIIQNNIEEVSRNICEIITAKEFHLWEEEFLINFLGNFLLLFKEFNSLIRFESCNISAIQTFLVVKIIGYFQNKKTDFFNLLAELIKAIPRDNTRFNNLFNDVIDVSFSMTLFYNFRMIGKHKEIPLNKKVWFKKHLEIIRSSTNISLITTEQKEQRIGKFLLTMISILLNPTMEEEEDNEKWEKWKLNISNYFEMFIEDNFKEYYKYIRKFLESQNKNILTRIFEWIYIRGDHWKENSSNEIAHYTSLESLYNILKTNELKFSSITSLNDKDEGKLIEVNNPDDSKFYCISFTQKKDSVDLFNNYTKMNGISIVFSKNVLWQNLVGLFFEKKTNEGTELSSIQFEHSSIQYNNNPMTLIDEWIKNVKKIFKKFTPKEHLENSLENAKRYLSYFHKKSPWEYEEEYRVGIQIPNNKKIKAKKLLAARLDDKDLFVKLNLTKRLDFIKRIIISPKIKNSEFWKNSLKNILKENDLHTKIEILDSEANINKGFY